MKTSSVLVETFVTLHYCVGLAPRPSLEQWMMTSSNMIAADETHVVPHVHSDIISILDCHPSDDGDSVEYVDRETLAIRLSDTAEEPAPVSTQILVDMAYASDNALYRDLNAFEKEPVLHALAVMGESGDDSAIVAAALLSLNFLESAIRMAKGYTAGRAPLLKTMVTRLSDTTLASILMTLLLPQGLNLRNLLWHGFIATDLPRRWLSLVLILTYNLKRSTTTEKIDQESTTENNSLNCMLKEASVCASLTTRCCDSDSMKIVIMDWLPKSHHDLLDLAFAWKDTRPTCSLALLSIILEHGLRLDWCRINDLPEHSIARPGAYFVTLDGHGQKHQHDLLLFPYIGENLDTENKLIAHLGGHVVALLTDLFASSSGGPNLRAALAHGLWDTQLERELLDEEKSDDHATDLLKMTNLVIIAMQSVAKSSSPAMCQYKPLFSHRAVTLRNLENVSNQLQRLYSLRERISMSSITIMSNDHIATLNVSETFDPVARRLLCALEISDGQEWRSQHVFKELEINTIMAENGATQSLLQDLGVVTLSFASTLQVAMEEVIRESNNTECHVGRRIKRARRVCSVADVATTLYRFAAFVAILSLEQPLGIHCTLGNDDDDRSTLRPDVILKAVERSRMCISTFDNFLLTNTDRSLKAAVEFTKSKAVKTVLLYKQEIAEQESSMKDKR
jgi:hypothetical protein